MSCNIPRFDPSANLDHEDVGARLRCKLHPRRFTAMSAQMAALVGYILDEPYVELRIWELFVTSDGCGETSRMWL